MKVFTCTFKGFYPVGTAAVIVAKDEQDARILIDIELLNRGLGRLDLDRVFTELDTDEARAYILCDGNY